MREKYSYYPFFILVGIYIGYLQIVNRDMIFYGLYIFLFVFLLFNQSKQFGMPRNVFSIGTFIWLIYMIVSVYHTYSIDSGLKYSIVIIIFSISGIIFSGLSNWTDIFFRCLVLFLTGHVLFTFFSIFFTDSALRISGMLLDDAAQELTRRWAYEMNHYAGLSGQTVINAFFFAILLGITVSEILIQRKSYIKVVLCGIAVLLFILLIMTGKKASIFVVIFAVALTVFFYYFNTLSRDKILKIYFSVSLLIIGVLFCGILLINKEMFNSFMGTSIVSRGRIYNDLGTFFSQAPLWGNGVDSITFYVGHSAHNNYIQLLCEYGIIGFGLMLFIQVAIIVDILRLSGKYMKQKVLDNAGKRVVLFFIFYQIYFIVTGLFESTLFNYRMYLIYIISIAACYSVFNFKGKVKNEKNTVCSWKSIG